MTIQMKVIEQYLVLFVFNNHIFRMKFGIFFTFDPGLCGWNQRAYDASLESSGGQSGIKLGVLLEWPL